MLVLSRKVGESIVIDGVTTIRVARCQGGKVRLAIDAPRDVPVAREELWEREWHGSIAASAKERFVLHRCA